MERWQPTAHECWSRLNTETERPAVFNQGSNPRAIGLVLLRERADRGQDSLIDIVLRFARGLKSTFRYPQRMVSILDQMKEVRRFHLRADFCEKIERAKWVACSLDKKNWRFQGTRDPLSPLDLLA